MTLPKDKLLARREYYLRNLEAERHRARVYAARRRAEETETQANVRKARHREAAARYRASNRWQLKINEWERRKRLHLAKEREADEAEYQAFLAMEEEDEEVVEPVQT